MTTVIRIGVRREVVAIFDRLNQAGEFEKVADSEAVIRLRYPQEDVAAIRKRLRARTSTSSSGA